MNREQKREVNKILTNELHQQFPLLSLWRVKIAKEDVKGLEHYNRNTRIEYSEMTISIPADFGIIKMFSEIRQAADVALSAYINEAYRENDRLDALQETLEGKIYSAMLRRPEATRELLARILDNN